MYVYLWLRHGRVASYGTSKTPPSEADVARVKSFGMCCIRVDTEKNEVSRHTGEGKDTWKQLPEIEPLYEHNAPDPEKHPVRKGAVPAKDAKTPAKKPDKKVEKAEAPAKKTGPLEQGLQRPTPPPPEPDPSEEKEADKEKEEEPKEDDEKEPEDFGWAPNDR